jgi:hypothetical protein
MPLRCPAQGSTSTSSSRSRNTTPPHPGPRNGRKHWRVRTHFRPGRWAIVNWPNLVVVWIIFHGVKWRLLILIPFRSPGLGEHGPLIGAGLPRPRSYTAVGIKARHGGALCTVSFASPRALVGPPGWAARPPSACWHWPEPPACNESHPIWSRWQSHAVLPGNLFQNRPESVGS